MIGVATVGGIGIPSVVWACCSSKKNLDNLSEEGYSSWWI